MSEMPSKIREMMMEIDELKENFKRLKGESEQLAMHESAESN